LSAMANHTFSKLRMLLINALPLKKLNGKLLTTIAGFPRQGFNHERWR